MLKKSKFCLFNFFENISFSYLVFLFGILILLFNPIFYLFLFFVSGINVEFSLLFIYSIDLIFYFLHLSYLDLSVWSSKEILHYVDVRIIFDKFIYFGLVCGLFLSLNCKKINFRNLVYVKKYLKYVVLFPLLVLPFFSYFWNYIFHPLLFSNDLWLMYPSDLSYHIFNEVFFALFYVAFVFVEFGLFWLIDRKYKNN
jgi:hypothetical protein